MSAFQPLIRIAGTAFPYWVIVAAFSSVLAGFMAQRKQKRPFLVSALLQAGVSCAFFFMVLGIYVQLTGRPISFVELLPSSLLVALVLALSVSAAGLIFSRSEAEVDHLPTMVVGVVVMSVLFGVFLAFVVSFFPKLIMLQWHLLKHH